MKNCFHCGEACKNEHLVFQEKDFCCHGCKTVYEILNESDLTYYYDLQEKPGISPVTSEGKFDFLDNKEIAEKLLEFNEGNTQIVNFLVPSMHCSSCIWVLENLGKLNNGVKSAQVDFPKKTVRISFSPEKINLKELVYLLSKIGYEPYISLKDYDERDHKVDRSLIYKLGVAGFAFGNVMFLSFPEYFEVKEFWLEQFKHLFRWLMFAFSLPVVFYSGSGYFVSAYKGLRAKILNIDVPIALGIAVLFIRSTTEILLDLGTGFFDSLTGLVFFLLLGKFFQQKTYSYLSFERDYKSYFPMAVTRLTKNNSNESLEEQIQVYKIKAGDRILIRNGELIPIDAVLIKGQANIDYSFVTGEAEVVRKESGETLYAGGRQQGGVLEIEAIKAIDQSYLTKLWSNEVFDKDKNSEFQTLINQISKRFTTGVLSIAFTATLFWLIYDPSKALNVFTAVLIIACPCAIALATPFTLGNLLRIFGRNKFYLKEASVIEQIAKIDCVVFDKTGTITSNNKTEIFYEGLKLNTEEQSLLSSSLRASSHPLSRQLYQILDKNNIQGLDEFQEYTGQGISAETNGNRIKIGSETFVRDFSTETKELNKTSVHISSNEEYKGCYVFKNSYREGLAQLFKELGESKKLFILSGDNDGEKERLEKMLPLTTRFYFNQKPDDKLAFIKKLQEEGKLVMMIGDGLNDAGALAQSNVGIAISENINVFSPACDGILEASNLPQLSKYFQLSAKGIKIIKWSFVLSLCYNAIGLAFAVTGNLMPVIAAILMPLSSISIVAFATLATNLAGKKLKRY
ncbi:heavy metal translocating P-type ATPase [Salegentibacter maritimus]|uniref:heavy metal translocating P-type ATPase n=1 Tax=Salegentibacter maritimus TaxID=2794347 RepID=UPI0018E4CC44|nr:heavy metal translocating P-type ATPase metal-binding domain-containing protein [Salegentibacter maritimus]MBI6117715.1 heavy metal translocating P-type ATPase metal-binding domain-containing protein [Salegentibacter maritimus]